MYRDKGGTKQKIDTWTQNDGEGRGEYIDDGASVDDDEDRTTWYILCIFAGDTPRCPLFTSNALYASFIWPFTPETCLRAKFALTFEY